MARYSVQPRDQMFVKSYGVLSFAKSISKNLSDKYSQKRLDYAKQSTTDALKTTSNRVTQKTAETTGNLIGKKNC